MYTFAGSSVIYKIYNRKVKISNIGLCTESQPDISARLPGFSAESSEQPGKSVYRNDSTIEYYLYKEITA